MAEIEYLQVFPDYYISIFYLFQFFDNHINPCKIWCIAIKTCLKRIETSSPFSFSLCSFFTYSYKDLFKKD